MKASGTASLFLIAALTAWPGVAFSQDRREIANDIHGQIIKNHTQYRQVDRDKALAGCINWDTSAPNNVDVLHFFYYYTSEGSDRPFLGSQLMRSAVNACNGLRKKNDSNCECVPIDKNRQSALKVPDSFIKKVQTSKTLN